MQQHSFPQVSPWQIRRAVQTLKQGGILAYPTEAVFGLGCLPDNHNAIRHLLQLKQRPAEKGLILLAAELSQLSPWLSPVEQSIMAKVLASWPGPSTWLMPTPKTTSPLIRGRFDTIAVRISAHPVVQALCCQSQSAIISTSANISAGTMAYNALDVRLRFGTQLDYILHGPLGSSARPTIIRDALTDKLIRGS